jgi:hypothetical protein
MEYILSFLTTLFPDCIIKHAIFIKGIDGKMYDLSTINTNEGININQSCKREYIVIDWS